MGEISKEAYELFKREVYKIFGKHFTRRKLESFIVFSVVRKCVAERLGVEETEAETSDEVHVAASKYYNALYDWFVDLMWYAYAYAGWKVNAESIGLGIVEKEENLMVSRFPRSFDASMMSTDFFDAEFVDKCGVYNTMFGDKLNDLFDAVDKSYCKSCKKIWKLRKKFWIELLRRGMFDDAVAWKQKYCD